MSDYDEIVDVKRCSIFTGGVEVKETTTLTELLDADIPLLVEFAKDDDIQYMKICSANIGTIRSYQKRYPEREKPPLGMAKKEVGDD